jgi:hypothetical protein
LRGADLDDRLIACARDGVVLPAARPAPERQQESGIAPARALSEQMPPADDAAIWLALAPPSRPALPGELLQQLRAAGYVVQGFADRAALLGACLRGTSPLAVLDLSRQHCAISVVMFEGDSAALRRHIALPGGESALHDAWLQLAASTLVQQTRFDPLHDQRQETQLRQHLPAMAAEAQRDGQARCSIDAGGTVLALVLSRDQLAAAAAAWLQPLATALQAISAATDDCTLLVPESLLQIPGFDATLDAARFAHLRRFADGLPACAASLLPASSATTTGAVRYLTRVPLFSTAADPRWFAPLTLHDRDAATMATHVVYRGRVLPIPASGLVMGRDPGDAGALRLPEGIAGLSRRHCTLQRADGRTQIIDHSRHGSFVDGLRVRGRAWLPAGSVLRLGDPGIELPLVALDPIAPAAV